ncbi:3195_t:CDS:2 [Dentiscutata erythropus]|uniref:3195_t:CDS:1 n=1 Tax=Dentiscutata erythropus TaxID=1348616 RepID=A0A9N9I9B6_9GLOM|nr:3195_t:CDS:2 [Dentiscutata erythropus]
MTAQPSNNAQPLQRDQVPRDSKVMELIIRSAGVSDFEPKVVQQLLEFTHRYTIDVIQDAAAYAEHTGKNDIDDEDIKLAIQGRINHSFIHPPQQEFLIQLAKEQNKEPLPQVPLRYGLRLPPERHCLTALNFKIKPESPALQQFAQENPVTSSQPEISQDIPVETNDDQMEIQSYNDHTIAPSTVTQDNSSHDGETDYDMPDVESPDLTSGMNENWKRVRPAEDDNYDF